MSIKVYWLNSIKTVVVNEVEGFWSLNDFWISIEKTHELMSTVNHTVHLIIDMSHSRGLPQGFLSTLRSVRTRTQPNAGMTMLVGANPLLVAFSKMFSRLFPTQESRFSLVSTMTDAYNELKKQGIELEMSLDT